MIEGKRIQQLAEAYVKAVNAQDVDALLALCAEGIEYSGLLVKKLAGENSGTVRGKEAVGRFLRDLLKQWGPASYAVERLGLGVRSVVIAATVSGMIPGFLVLIFDPDEKIAQVLMHQEMK